RRQVPGADGRHAAENVIVRAAPRIAFVDPAAARPASGTPASVAAPRQSRYIFGMNPARGHRRAFGATGALRVLPLVASGNRTLGGLHLLSVLGPLLRPAR